MKGEKGMKGSAGNNGMKGATGNPGPEGPAGAPGMKYSSTPYLLLIFWHDMVYRTISYCHK